MEKVKSFFKWFNRPAQIFEAIGYIVVSIGLICIIFGIISMIVGIVITPLQFLFMGAIIAIVSPQIFFAMAKVVKAAEKYTGEEYTDEEYIDEE